MAVDPVATIHPLRPPRVLVVSADADWLRTARALLDLQGFLTTGRTGIADAVRAANRERWDVLVVDVTGGTSEATRLISAAQVGETVADVILVADDPAALPASMAAVARSAPEQLVDAIDHLYQRPRYVRVRHD